MHSVLCCRVIINLRNSGSSEVQLPQTTPFASRLRSNTLSALRFRASRTVHISINRPGESSSTTMESPTQETLKDDDKMEEKPEGSNGQQVANNGKRKQSMDQEKTVVIGEEMMV